MAKLISKKLRNTFEQFDHSKEYFLIEAMEIVKKISFVKFDASVDLTINLNLDTRKAEQQLRGSVLLPNGTGKNVKLLVATDDTEQQKMCKSAGAEIVVGLTGLEEILKKGDFNFDVMVAEPKMMITIGKYGKILGPKGLMPNLKTGTVTSDTVKAVKELKKGKANYCTDKSGIIHSLIGKVSMNSKALAENAETLVKLIKKLKPTTVKGTYLKSVYVSSTMGPSVKIKIDQL